MRFRVIVDLRKLPSIAFRERKEGTFHIGNRYIPLKNWSVILPCITGVNGYRTVERVSIYFRNIFSSLNRKDLYDTDAKSIPIWKIIGD